MGDSCASVTSFNSTLFSSEKTSFQKLSLGFYLLELFIALICIIIWFKYHLKYERTRIRSSTMVVMAILGLIISSTVTHLGSYSFAEFPCWLSFELLALSVPLVAGPIVARLSFFFFLSKFSEETLLSLSNRNELELPEHVPQSLLIVFIHSNRLLICGQKEYPNAETRRKNLYAFRFMTSFYGALSVVIVMVIPFGICSLFVIISNPLFFVCYGCESNFPLLITMVTIIIILTIWGSIVLYRIRKYKDSWGLKSENFYCCILIGFTVLFFLFQVFLDSFFLDTDFSFSFVTSIFITLAVMEQSIVQVFIAWRSSRNPTKIPLALLAPDSFSSNSSSSVLDMILEDKTLSEAFEEHLRNEFGLESLLFIRDIDSWKKTFFDIAPTARKARAGRIINLYIKTNGLLAINIPDDIQRDVEIGFGKEEIERNLFDVALGEVKHLLLIGAVTRFMHSKKYADLTNTYQAAIAI